MSNRISENKLDTILTVAIDAIEDNSANNFLTDAYVTTAMRESLKKKINRMNSLARLKEEISSVLQILRKIIAVILVVSMISFIVMLSVESVRAIFWDAVVKWYDKYIAIYFVNNTNSNIPLYLEKKKSLII